MVKKRQTIEEIIEKKVSKLKEQKKKSRSRSRKSFGDMKPPSNHGRKIFLCEREEARKKMGYSVRNGKFGYECDVCGGFIGDLKLSNICRQCCKRICLRCSIVHFIPSKLPPHLFRYRRIEKPSYVCPDCKEELEKEEFEAQAKEEEESPRIITTCQRGGANDEPPESKIFGYSPPHFLNCERCGRLAAFQRINNFQGKRRLGPFPSLALFAWKLTRVEAGDIIFFCLFCS